METINGPYWYFSIMSSEVTRKETPINFKFPPISLFIYSIILYSIIET